MLSRICQITSAVALLVAPRVAIAQEPAAPPGSPPPVTETTATVASPPPGEPSVAPADTPSAAPDKPPPGPELRRWFVHLNVGVPVYTTIGAWTTPTATAVKAQSITPADRFALVELVGAGYWVHPHVRLNL